MDEKSSEVVAKGVVAAGGACALLPFIIALSVMIYVYSLLSTCGMSPPPTDEELARLEAQQAQRQQKDEAFQRQQALLWTKPASSLTERDVATELFKCRQQIMEKQRSPYEWIFDHIDPKKSLDEVKSFAQTDVSSQNRKDVPLSANVELAKYTCYFRGAGYESFSKDPNTHYTSTYLNSY